MWRPLGKALYAEPKIPAYIQLPLLHVIITATYRANHTVLPGLFVQSF